jgi:hypothetical protein
MSNVSLFDKAGRYTPPDAATFSALSDPERVAINRIADTAAILEAANQAAQANADALKATQAEIAKLAKLVPTVSRIDLVRQQMRDTQRRRSGL